MEPTMHTFDPDGDLLLIFERPSDAQDEMKGNDGSETVDVDRRKLQGNSDAKAFDRGRAANIEEWNLPATEVHTLVSSKHMKLASPVFRAMLDPSNFAEGKKLSRASKGAVPRVQLPDDDPTAFIMLLAIIHGRPRQVPLKVDLNLMSSISILIDKYQMQDIAHLFSEIWLPSLKPEVPKAFLGFERETAQWLSISWIFERQVEFNQVTSLLQKGCPNVLDGYLEGLPIPDVVLNTINDRRQTAIRRAMAVVDDLILKYQGKDIICPTQQAQTGRRKACDAMVLGSLIKGATTILGVGIWPPPKEPYGGISFTKLIRDTRAMYIADLCDADSKTIHKTLSECHGVKDSIEASLRSLEDTLCGLDLHEIKGLNKEKLHEPRIAAVKFTRHEGR